MNKFNLHPVIYYSCFLYSIVCSIDVIIYSFGLGIDATIMYFYLIKKFWDLQERRYENGIVS